MAFLTEDTSRRAAPCCPCCPACTASSRIIPSRMTYHGTNTYLIEDAQTV